jgi:hypothetical protein
MRSTNGMSNEVCLAWLEGALEQAFENRQPELRAYLEAVMEEVLFEIETPRPGTARG